MESEGKTPVKALVKTRGPASDSQAKKTRSIEEEMGIEALEFGGFEVEGQAVQSSGNRLPILQQFNEVIDDEIEIEIDKNQPKIQIGLDDIQEEVDYWNSAIIYHVLGANPPTMVMEGFVRRIWRNLGVDKVGMVEKGIFIVRFNSMENRDKVVNGRYPFFDGKPVMIKAWYQDMDFKRGEGQRCLTKIVSKVGKYLKVDNATLKREKLQLAKVLVEVDITQSCPDEIIFENEKKKDTRVHVTCDWKPTYCKDCMFFGHDVHTCRKRKKHIWVPRQQGEKQREVVVCNTSSTS
ncbi:uncharacterized protein LOC104890269 [Beta vulgaris subsp. vulgaris]|uniref:uncharacterized protein LOC104890269 n=1 Tax=Beta vulgaris subsp. vulgaris TaxID=3555 RepID=UPI002546C2C7|nr:uncharacterized protein LOC104890269 [Beta vulgaris subsp. vulgaris]